MHKEISSSFDFRTIEGIDSTGGPCNDFEDEHDVYIQEHQSLKIDVDDQSDNINSSITPRVDMEFSSGQDAFKFYKQFSLKEGFGIRKCSSYKSRNTDVLLRRTFVCYKEGFKRDDKRNKDRQIKRRRDEREGCKARIVTGRNKESVWVVKTFENHHNHALINTPKKKQKLRSHNKAHKQSSCKNLIDQFHSCGVGPAKISRLVNAANGDGLTMITPEQCYSHLRIKQKNNIGKERIVVIQKFLERQARDTHFYYAIQIDENQVCRSIFWADGRARTSYMPFNDVVVFDVTYKTNNFKMPFAPFTGVNHHRQLTLFGCALLADEQEDTFIWLFEQWLKCMWDKFPSAIITDQDTAIHNAIAKVFPHTRHRYCSWHLSLHEGEHIRSLQCAHNPDFDEHYKTWAKKSRSIEDSKKCWATLTKKYKPCYEELLTDKQKNEVKSWKWLESMYNQRHHWVKAYLRDTFFASMKSSQRSESMNAYSDGYVHSTTPLPQFVEQYDNVVSYRRDKKEKEDLITMTTQPNFTELHPLKAHTGKVYTRNIFNLFKEEFKQVFHCRHKKVRKQGDDVTYEVHFTFKNKVISHIVEMNASNMHFKCTCGKFETWGILCKHTLYIMKQKLFVESIPDKYILPRWTLSARHSTTCGDGEHVNTYNDLRKNEVTPLKAWNLRIKFNKLYERAICNRNIYNVTKSDMNELWNKVDEIEMIELSPMKEGSNYVASQLASTEGVSAHVTIRDPTKCKTKGRSRTASRIPTGMQVAQFQAQKQQRTCSKCNEKGHDTRTCKKEINE